MSVDWNNKEVSRLIKLDKDLQQAAHVQARPYGGLTDAQNRSSWNSRTDIQGHVPGDGFAKFSMKPEGGSTEMGPATNWERERLSVMREHRFGGNQKAFSGYLAKLRKYARRIPTASEVLACLDAGPKWREVMDLKPKGSPLPREKDSLAYEVKPEPKPGTPASVFDKPEFKPGKNEKPVKLKLDREKLRHDPVGVYEKKPNTPKPVNPVSEFGEVKTFKPVDLPLVKPAGKVPGYKKPSIPQTSGVLSKAEEVSKAVSDGVENVAKAVKNSKNVKKALTFAEEILAKRSKMK